MCNLGRMSSLEFENSVPVKAKVGLLHRWWNAVIHIATIDPCVHGEALCLEQVAKMRIADAPDGAPNYVKMWQVRRNNFTELSFFRT